MCGGGCHEGRWVRETTDAKCKVQRVLAVGCFTLKILKDLQNYLGAYDM